MASIFVFASLTCFAQHSYRELNYDSIPVPFTGKLIDAYQMKDKAGDHIFLVTKTENPQKDSTILYGYKFTKNKGRYVRKWLITDAGSQVLLYFKYTRIIDLDKDGIYETVFVYQLNPDLAEGSEWRVMIHSKDKKFVLRAHVPEMDYDRYKVTFDKAYQHAPLSIRNFAGTYWNKIAKEQQLKTK